MTEAGWLDWWLDYFAVTVGKRELADDECSIGRVNNGRCE